MSAPRPDIDGIFLPDKAVCELCGEPMPAGEEMFKFHGYSGPCQPMRAPRPEGMSDKLRCRNCGRAECMGPIVCAADMSPSARELKRLKGELDRLRADGATLKVRADEALAAHSASFGALQTLSAALFDGEVDDYAALAEKVIARVRQAESDGATLRERVKALEEEANYLTSRLDDVEGCGARAGGFECTAPKGHRGDHIAHETEGREVHRWPTTASAPKEPTPHVHATMGASGPCTICGVPVRCSNLKDGQATCDEPNVYCAHPKCLQPKEPTPHAVRETGWLIEHSQEGLLKYWSPSSTEHRTWVIDPWQAVRFSRREDAERVKVALNYAFSAVIEHAFMPKEPTPHE